MTTRSEAGAPSPLALKVKVTEMDHIVLRVRDVDASLRFYVDVLNLAPERVEEFKAGKVRFPSLRLTDDTIIDLFPFPEMPPIGDGPRNEDHFCMVVEPMDLAGLRAELEAMGVRIQQGPLTRWGARGDGTSLYIFDPDDNLVELRYYE